MQREVRKYLDDVQYAISLLHEFTRGKTFKDYRQEAMLRAAVEREFEIIGEALSQLAKIDPALADRISDHRRIIAFRNLLIHGYADVDAAIVWDIVSAKLRKLEREIEVLLADV